RVVADVAGQHLLDGEAAGAEGQRAAGDVVLLVAGQEPLDDLEHARVDGPDQTGAGRLQRLGDEPGEALVVAHAGDQRHLAAQVQGDHAGPRRGVELLTGSRSSKSGQAGQGESGRRAGSRTRPRLPGAPEKTAAPVAGGRGRKGDGDVALSRSSRT